MKDFFTWQADHVYFFYGFASVFFAVACYAMMQILRVSAAQIRASELSGMNKRLEQEIAERRSAEEELRRHREHLTELVKEQTADLT
ncbi:MAG: hypothetical protein WA946_14815, partial [Nitrospirota bacterium]